MNTLILGVVGSQAYGLARPDSDVDRLGIYAAPTTQFLGLHPPAGANATVVQHDPDVTMHEAGKFAALALKCNPSVLELLWLTSYEILTPLGEEVVGIRDAFASQQLVRDAYFGYAKQQLWRIRSAERQEADVTRLAKHARHILRLLHQGLHLYQTGRLVVRLLDPDWYITQGRAIAENPDHGQFFLDKATKEFDETPSRLPERPDERRVERWLQRVRAAHYNQGEATP